jgi:hypothetical protein
MRILLFLSLAAAAASYALWVYSRVELPVKGARWMALARVAALVIILTLLFDPRLPGTGQSGVSGRWVVLDASLSMMASSGDRTPWNLAQARAQELSQDGWTVVRMGEDLDTETTQAEGVESQLAPVLERAAESGARDVVVLSDLRLADVAAVQAALESLPLSVTFEEVGGAVANVGVTAFDVPDAPRPGGTVMAEVEVHGHLNDSATVRLFADGASVGVEKLSLPAPGLRRTHFIEIAVPEAGGRVRYTARISGAADAFPSDDEAVTYASVGYAEGALVVVSLFPDWEPRFLLPVLEDVTGLPALGYLRVGPERFIPIGRALDRAPPIDSSVVGRAVRDAAFVVVHGLDADSDAWARRLTARSGRLVIMPRDANGAQFAGVATSGPRGGEWYASGDVPSSPISGELSGATLLGLPPLTNVLVPTTLSGILSPLNLQFRGTGRPEAALHLEDGPNGRRVITLASGFWRWAMRDGEGREAYRRLWSGVAGWLLSDDGVVAPEPRPTDWVFERRAAVRFSIPGDSTGFRLFLSRGDTVVADTLLTSGVASLGAMPPAQYAYRFADADGETVVEGSFDVAAATAELLPRAAELSASEATRAGLALADQGRPLRTFAWPYLLVIMLLCGEWIARRRSGLR